MDQPGLRERKKQRTEREIAQAALELCCLQGFNATTVEQIAEAAEVSTSTFFRYFGSKEAALLLDRERLGRTDALWPALEHADSFEEVLHVVEDYAVTAGRAIDAESRGKDRIRLILDTPSLNEHQLRGEGMVEEAMGRRLTELGGNATLL